MTSREWYAKRDEMNALLRQCDAEQAALMTTTLADLTDEQLTEFRRRQAALAADMNRLRAIMGALQEPVVDIDN